MDTSIIAGGALAALHKSPKKGALSTALKYFPSVAQLSPKKLPPPYCTPLLDLGRFLVHDETYVNNWTRRSITAIAEGDWAKVMGSTSGAGNLVWARITARALNTSGYGCKASRSHLPKW